MAVIWFGRLSLRGSRTGGEAAAGAGIQRGRRGVGSTNRTACTRSTAASTDGRVRSRRQFSAVLGEACFAARTGVSHGARRHDLADDDGDHTVRHCTLDGKVLLASAFPASRSPT